jgi:hypothetical protein
MPTTKSEFQDLAAELKEEFQDFFIARTFTAPGGYDPVTEVQVPGAAESVECLREDYTAGQIDGQSIQKNDFKLLAVAADFSVIHPKTDGLKVNVDGKVCSVVNANLDAADAVWTLQVRG